jgi:hypothetical protein
MGESSSSEVNEAGRTPEQEERLRELASRLPERDPELPAPEWVERARLEVARRAVQSAAQPELE